MRRLWVGAGLLLLVVSLTLSAIFYTQHIGGSMTAQIQHVWEITEQGDYEKAQQAVAETERFWAWHRPLLCAFLDHRMIDVVDEDIASLKVMLAMQEQSWALNQCADLTEALDKLQRMELPLPENIF